MASTKASSGFSDLLALIRPHLKPFRWFLVLLVAGFLIETALTSLRPLVMAPILNLILHPELVGQPAPELNITWRSLDLNNIGVWAISLAGVQNQSLFRAALFFSGLFFFVTIISSAISYAGLLLSAWIRHKVRRALELQLFTHLLSLPLRYHFSQRSGTFVARLEDDTGEVTRFIDSTLRTFVMSPLLILFYGTLMVSTNPKLAVAAVGGGFLHMMLTKGMEKPIRRAAKHSAWESANLSARLHEAFTSIRVIKIFCAERLEIARLWDDFNRILRVQMFDVMIRNVQRPFRTLVDAAVQIGVTLFAIYELSEGRLSTEGFFLFVYVGMSTLGPISNLAGAISNLHLAYVARDRMHSLLSTASSVTDGSRDVESFNSCIEIRNASYSYGAVQALRNVSLSIHKGETVALVGPSGAGKSTLIDLLVRFDDPTSGSIALDGQDIKGFSQDGYRRLFRMVPQESMLFNASLYDNIVYGRSGITKEQVEAAAATANSHEFITALPEGYATHVGDRGIRLSGGQRQRVALARAIVDNPSILILDEATSALDSESERQVQSAIDRVLGSVTAVIIAHRLSTVLHANKIVVMDKGVIVDSGSHQDLLERCALYKRLCELQFDERLMQSLAVKDS
ncbi:MAG: ABC transporter ATP-binding protein [Rhodospirillales bacterium]|nr:MAG: ABC transporter ATP-binding protein [Rhodospirillales bacterium]